MSIRCNRSVDGDAGGGDGAGDGLQEFSFRAVDLEGKRAFVGFTVFGHDIRLVDGESG